MEIPESQNARDARIEQLWQKLDPQKRGELDINGLKKGLSKIDHPLKNATDMLKDVVNAMDKNGDQVIQYEEFRVFVERTEKELISLFHSIDRDHDGRLDKGELRAAFRKAGLTIPNSKLDQFFAEVDQNHDGYITFEEWRNFLLFLPTNKNPGLKAVISYYSSTVSINSEGDTSISEETLEGAGNSSPRFSLLQSLFGSIMKIAEAPKSSQSFPSESTDRSIPGPGTAITAEDNMDYDNAHLTWITPECEADEHLPTTTEGILDEGGATCEKSLLTEIFPHPGYFVAGGIAGAISRTATAPLDRLKVYLIAHIDSPKDAISAAAKGDTSAAVRHLGQPLVDASRALWKAGGIRSLFAGNGLNIVKVMPESAIKFGSYEAAKRALAKLEGHSDPNNINPYSKFAAGGVGGLISQLAVYPIDTLKFRMQCETIEGGLHGNALIKATAKKMYEQGGFRVSYRGLNMGLLGMFPYAAIDLGTFEYMKGKFTEYNAKRLGCHEEDAAPGSFTTGLIGAFSGSVGASLVYPINLIRTRLQAQGTILHPPTYNGAWDVASRTVKNEGVRGLFKGLVPNLLKVVPAVSITYVVYENGKKVMHLS